jgi:hypothetical protein
MTWRFVSNGKEYRARHFPKSSRSGWETASPCPLRLRKQKRACIYEIKSYTI